ncbi:pre-mRNA cleavage factor Im 25 kDa subunit 1 isoform X2 [Cynara cardunculus var. scolymus]|uniref:pre-mRNA cleavage factor Im 25 kDa subunit 1 isoform X2 n=1 Tax=Cynara cardunculus var. scolymus TaxID=59895 RepID=UPI000D62EF14|nr:pre-mRNA cleavage factor Im 25 kDa subunit 1 isoform X2 [Cynara cardunculus var. scolymus]
MEIMNGRLNNGGNLNLVFDIYPLSNYYFSSKPGVSSKEETLGDRARRLKSNYDVHGMRTYVEAVILVELFKHPHLLLLQAKNCIYKLPGGRLRPGESDVDGLKRKLSTKLSADETQCQWEVGECIGTWWKSDFETLPFPYLPSSGNNPKECTKLYLVKLPSSRDFVVPKNLKLLAVPMCQLHESRKTYGPIISGIPQLLSRFAINMVGS